MKRFLVLLLAAAMCLALAGCGGKEEKKDAPHMDYMKAEVSVVSAEDSDLARYVIYYAPDMCLCIDKDSESDDIQVFLYDTATGESRDVTARPEDEALWTELLALYFTDITEEELAERIGRMGAMELWLYNGSGRLITWDINGDYVMLRKYGIYGEDSVCILDTQNAVIWPLPLSAEAEGAYHIGISSPVWTLLPLSAEAEGDYPVLTENIVFYGTLLSDGSVAVVTTMIETGASCALRIFPDGSRKLITTGDQVFNYLCFGDGIICGIKNDTENGIITASFCDGYDGGKFTDETVIDSCVVNETVWICKDGKILLCTDISAQYNIPLVNRDKKTAEVLWWDGEKMHRETAEEFDGDYGERIRVLGVSADGRYMAFEYRNCIYMMYIESLDTTMLLDCSDGDIPLYIRSTWNGSNFIFTIDGSGLEIKAENKILGGVK